MEVFINNNLLLPAFKDKGANTKRCYRNNFLHRQLTLCIPYEHKAEAFR
jgi:hypothetical protein